MRKMLKKLFVLLTVIIFTGCGEGKEKLLENKSLVVEKKDPFFKRKDFDSNLINVVTKTPFNEEGYNVYGVNAFGYNEKDEFVGNENFLKYGFQDNDKLNKIIDGYLLKEKEYFTEKSDFETVDEYNSRQKSEFQTIKNDAKKWLNENYIYQIQIQMKYNAENKRWEIPNYLSETLNRIGSQVKAEKAFSLKNAYTEINTLVPIFVQSGNIYFEEEAVEAKERKELVIVLKCVVTSKGIENPIKTKKTKDSMITEFSNLRILSGNVLAYTMINAINSQILKKELYSEENMIQGVEENQIELKERIAFKKGESEAYTGIVKNFHSNGKLKKLYFVKNGKKEGIYREYYTDGKLLVEIGHINGIVQGQLISYHKNGNIHHKANLRDNKPYGTYEWYHEEGYLKQEVSYENGQENGIMKWYHSNGNISQEVLVVNGKQNGIMKKYSKDGKLISTSKYVNGVKK